MLGSHAFLSLLADEGITYLFGNPGTTELPLMAALPRFPHMRYVLGAQEAAVVAMADGFARASGQLAVANVHVAPGLGNAMGSLFNAQWVGSPLIITAGQHETGHGLTEPMLYAPLEPIARPLVKWTVEITRLADLPRAIRRAAKIALAPPTGPVFMSLPGDVLDAEAQLELGQPNRVDAGNRPSDATLEHLAKRLLSAERPALICGHEVSTRRAITPAIMLAELLGATVYQDTIQTAASFVSTHDCYVGMLTRNQRDVAERLGHHDLLICLGTDLLRMSVPSDVSPLPPRMPVIQIGERNDDLAKNFPTEIALQANVRDTLDALTSVLQARQTLKHAQTAATRREQLQANNWSSRRAQLIETIGRRTGRPISPDLLMLRLAETLPPETIVVDEGLTSTRRLPELFAYRDAQSYYGLASGGIGFAIAGAIGIRLAVPDRPLVAVIGDGSALYNIQALWTAAHLRLPMVFVIANNYGYGILKERVRTGYRTETYVGMDFADPLIDFARLAAALGVPGHRIVDPDDIAPALQHALAHNGPTLLDIVVGEAR